MRRRSMCNVCFGVSPGYFFESRGSRHVLRTGLLSGGGKSLLRKEKRLRVNMEIAREKSKVIIR